MTILKFLKAKQKKHKRNKLYLLRIATTKKTTKFNHSIYLGSYVSNLKLYKLIYPEIISFLKLGANYAKQSSVISLFFLKKMLKQNRT